MLDDLGIVFLGLYLTQTEVNEVLVSRVIEIAQKVPFHSEVPVVYCSFRCSLTCRCEIGLHCGSARVENAHCVSILCPLGPEYFLKCLRELLEG
jgi:hypothetical protein